MTTIAYDGKTVASDTLMTVGSGSLLVPKFFRFPNKIIWFAGNCDYRSDYINFLLGRKYNEESITNFAECEAILITYPPKDSKKAPTVEIWGSTVGDIATEPVSIGSGHDLAKASMYLGKSAEEAVKIASVFDVYTNDLIHIVDVATGTIIKAPKLNRFKA